MFLGASPSFEGCFHSVPGGRRGAYATIGLMRTLVRDAVSDPNIINMACSVIHMAPVMDQLAEVDAVFNFVRGHVRYTRDIAGIETLADPRLTLRRMVGDCDDKATLLAALFEAIGYPTRFILAGYQDAKTYEHVYLQVLINGAWLDADATIFQPLGYAPPNPAVLWVEGGA